MKRRLILVFLDLKKAKKIIEDEFEGNQLFLELTDYFGNRKK